MLFQPSNIIPDEINGSGCVDVTQGISISWQVNGDSAMTAYQIDFYNNDALSTLLYSTGKIALTTPFWGVNYKGETQFFGAEISASVLSAAGITNGGEYKLLITQWWSETESIQQTTASLFLTRATPTVTINGIPNPLTSKAYSFTAVYTQAQGDPLKWVRWQIAEQSTQSDPFLDTGKITGTGELQVDYDGFFTDTTYSIMCTVETANGIEASSNWVDFTVSYSVSAPQGNVTACQIENDSCVFLQWDQMEIAQGYSILRRRQGENVLHKIKDVDDTTGQLRDYSARSGSQYTYYVFPTGELAYLTEPMVSNTVQVQFWFWAIIEATENEDGFFDVVATHLFRVGSGGVSEGEFSNNNSPSLNKNFSRYPTRQAETSNYLTGSVSGYIGTINKTSRTYTDTVEQSKNLFNLSTSTNALFLFDPKGRFLRIHTSGPVSLSVNHKSMVMPQTMTVPWVEIGSTDGISIVSAPGGDFYPTDQVIFTSIRVDPESGKLIWTTPENYSDGSTLQLEGGKLIQNVNGSFIAAAMEIGGSDGNELIASLET